MLILKTVILVLILKSLILKPNLKLIIITLITKTIKLFMSVFISQTLFKTISETKLIIISLIL